MPLSKKGKTILTEMRKEYGDKGEEIFYKSINAGKIHGAEKKKKHKK